MEKTLKEEQKYLEGKLKHNPDSILFARLAELYLSFDRIEDAVKLCEDGIRKHPSYVTGHYILSKCYLRQNKLENAKKELRRVLYYDPYYIAAHRDYGDLMDKEGWANTAIDSYGKILEVDPLNKAVRGRFQEITDRSGIRQTEPGEDFDIDIEDDMEDNAIKIPESQSGILETVKEIFDDETILGLDSTDDKRNIDNKNDEIYNLVNDIFYEKNLNDLEKTDSTTLPDAQFPPENDVKIEKKDFDVVEDARPPVTESDEKGITVEKKEDIDDTFSDFIDKVKNPSTKAKKDPESSVLVEPEQTTPKNSSEAPSKLVTSTLGEIYISQGQFNKALAVYMHLYKNDPSNRLYKERIDFINKKIAENNQH